MLDKQELDLFEKHKILISVDEVGMGSLAGPIVACAVVVKDLESLNELFLKPKRKIFELTDSKGLPSYVREEMVGTIKKVVDRCSYGIVYVDEINHVKNIYKCGFIARYRALQALNMNQGLVCIDGPFGNIGLPLEHVGIIGGDKKFKSIGAASILAKVFRDEWMAELRKIYPYYNWETNKGYGSKNHFEGLKKVGACDIHRFHVAGMNKYFKGCRCGNKSMVLYREGYRCLICNP